MKKTLLAASLAACTAVASFSTLAAPTGTITINGKLTASTCKVAVDNSATGDATVTLPTLPASQLATAGDVGGDTSFVMKLTDCTPSSATVRAYFEAGANVDAATGRLNNAATADAATNVQVQLLNDKNIVLAAGNTSQRSNAATPLTTGAATLPYVARYYATGAAGQGTVNTSVTYSIDYQ